MTTVNRDVGEVLSLAHAHVRLFVTDVAVGLRQVSHSALALLGLVAVATLLFMIHRPELRMQVEQRTLSWLSERASARLATLSESAENDVLLAVAEPEAILRATAINPDELNRQQADVAHWIARRYSVAPEAVARLVKEAWDVGQQARMDPTLILAIMAIESSFNPFAQSQVGAQGLMQVMTRVHHDKYEIFGGKNAAFDPVTNIRVGVQVLKDCIRRAGSVAGGLKHYVGAANMVSDGGYGAKVLAEQAFLRQVAAGQKVPVNVSNRTALLQAKAADMGLPALDAGANGASPANAVALPVAVPALAAPAANPIQPAVHRPESSGLVVAG